MPASLPVIAATPAVPEATGAAAASAMLIHAVAQDAASEKLATLCEAVPGLVGVYLLADPRDGAPRYVRATRYPAGRLRDHVRAARVAAGRAIPRWGRGRPAAPVTRWLAGILSEGVAVPQLAVVEWVPPADRQSAERKWIERLRARGLQLVNGSPGGEPVRAAPAVPEDAILPLLAEGPLSGRRLAKRLCVRWSEALRALHALEAAGQVVREGRGRAARWRV